MKYKLLFNERHKPAEYLITRNELIIWASPAMSVWVGQGIARFLSWVDFKKVGTWSLEGGQCTAPRVVRSELSLNEE